MWISSIEEWKDAGDAPAKAVARICCYIAGGEASPFMAEIMDIASAYPGGDEMYIKDTSTGELFRSPVRLNAPSARAELVTLLGEGNVKLA